MLYVKNKGVNVNDYVNRSQINSVILYSIFSLMSQLFDFELTPEETAVINKLGDANRRYFYCPSGFPFT